MQLLGAREFIKMPPGTYYIQYWLQTVEECFQIINKFKSNPKSFLEIERDDLHIFGDNWGSMCFSGSKKDNYIFYYDANVVGDASPLTTLYLVISENELPNKISFRDNNENIIQISKNKVIKIKNMFINNIYEQHDDQQWALKILDKLSKEGNIIIDIKIDSYII